MDTNRSPAPPTPPAQPTPAALLSDIEFLARFEAAAFGAAEYGHRDHVRTVWLYLRRCGREQAEAAVRDGIRRLSAAHGAPGRYHETLTRAWIALVADAAADLPGADFEEVLLVRPELLDKGAPLRFYSPERLWSEAARTAWIEPDLRPLPET